MPEAVFYILDHEEADGRARFGCVIARRCWREQRSLCVYVEDREQAARMDDLLWTFHDIGFLPHQMADDSLEPNPRIVVGWQEALPAQKDILLNLTDQIPPCREQFSRIIEIVAGSDEQRQQARARFQSYREQGYPLQHHELKSADQADFMRAAG